MVQKKKLVRDVPGSKQWQRKQPGYKAPEPAPVTSPVWGAGKGGLTVQEAQRAMGQQQPPRALGSPQGKFPEAAGQPQGYQPLGFVENLKLSLRQLTGRAPLPVTGKEIGKAGLQGAATTAGVLGAAFGGPAALAAGGAALGRGGAQQLSKVTAEDLLRYSEGLTAEGSRELVVAGTRAVELFTKGNTMGAVQRAAAGQAPKVTSKLGSAGRIVTNTVTATKTLNYLTRIGAHLVNPKMVAGVLLTTIGSYPFAGFIKEEALQTLSFGIKTALDNDNVEGADKALAEQAEILDPQLWSQIIAGVPYANVLKQLKDYYKAAATKLEIDANATDKLKEKLASGEESQFIQETRLAEQIKTEGFKERGDLLKGDENITEPDFPEPTSFEEHVQQQEFIRRAEQQPTALDGGRR